MLDSVRLRAQLVLLCDLTNPVARFIEESQLKDVVALSRKAAQMFDYVVLLRDRLKPAFLSNYVTGLLSDELLVVRDDVSAWYRVAAERGLQKWKKWSGMAERYLRGLLVQRARVPTGLSSRACFSFRWRRTENSGSAAMDGCWAHTAPAAAGEINNHPCSLVGRDNHLVAGSCLGSTRAAVCLGGRAYSECPSWHCRG